MVVICDFCSSLVMGSPLCVTQEFMRSGVPDFSTDVCSWAWFNSVSDAYERVIHNPDFLDLNLDLIILYYDDVKYFVNNFKKDEV